MDPRVEIDVRTRKLLLPFEGTANKAIVAFEIHQDPATGIQTVVGSNPDSSPYVIHFSIDSTCHSHLCDLLLDRLMNHPCLSEFLALHIASAANDLGFGINGFVLIMLLTRIIPRVPVVSSESVLQRLVCQGTINEEERKKLNI